jgi:hypothetical protein
MTPGPLIRSKDGFWLAIPLPAAGTSLRGGRITPGEWERRRGCGCASSIAGRGPSLLVAEGRLNTSRARCGVALEDRPRQGHRADLPAGAAGQAAEAAGPGAGCRAGAGQRAGADRGELGGGADAHPSRNHPHRAARAALGAARHRPARRGAARARPGRRPADPARRRTGRARSHAVAAALPLPAPRRDRGGRSGRRPRRCLRHAAPASAQRLPPTARWAGSATGSRRKPRARSICRSRARPA